MKYNLDGKTFRTSSNTANGEVSGETIFIYNQEGNRVWAEYAGGSIVRGDLVAIQDDEGRLEMYYHHINQSNELMVGRCISRPSVTPEGKLKFHEQWEWLNGDKSKGESTLVEV